MPKVPVCRNSTLCCLAVPCHRHNLACLQYSEAARQLQLPSDPMQMMNTQAVHLPSPVEMVEVTHHKELPS